MGQFGSSPKKNDKQPPERVSRAPVTVKNNADAFLQKYGKLLKERGFVPDFLLVKESQSSQFVDEDGSEGHEFYEELVDGNLRRLTRTFLNLKPKGTERHDIPRLSPDLPVVLLELPSDK